MSAEPYAPGSGDRAGDVAGIGATGAAPEGSASADPRAARRRARVREVLRRVGFAAGGTVFAVALVLELGRLGLYNLPYALSILPLLLPGLYTTLAIIAGVIPLGFALGFLIGWARTTRFWVARAFGTVYVDFFRSLPPIALIAFSAILGALLLRQAGVEAHLAQTVTLGLGAASLALHTAAYQAEIVRAGILSVPAGQVEAADAIGMTRLRSMFRVVLPQAFRVSLPALGNEFSSVIKDSSLLSTIGWLELSGIGLIQVVSALLISPLLPLLVWIEIAVLYFVVTFVLNTGVRFLENAFRVPGLEAAHL